MLIKEIDLKIAEVLFKIMDLDKYLKDNGIGNISFALEIGVHKVSVSRYRRKRIIPKVRILARIYEATKGQVTMRDFIPPPPLHEE